LQLERVAVHAHGTHGIVLTGASGGSIVDSEVSDVGCSGIRATAGVAETLQRGGLVVSDNHVHHVAQWKRSYMPVRQSRLQYTCLPPVCVPTCTRVRIAFMI